MVKVEKKGEIEMTAQEVMKAYMGALVSHGRSHGAALGMLDSAVRSSSRYGSMAAVKESLLESQAEAERSAVEKVLGKRVMISELEAEELASSSLTNEVYKLSNIYIGDEYDYSGYEQTVGDVIKELKARIFLEDYCGIVLPKKYFWSGSKWSSWSGELGESGNEDTGAITGFDAGGEVVLTAEDIVKEEYVNGYTALKAQEIVTSSRNWVIYGSEDGDRIISRGADYINAGGGSDTIECEGDGATITTGLGGDIVKIGEGAGEVRITDLSGDDELIILGDYEVVSSREEDGEIVIEFSDGRVLRLGGESSALQAAMESVTVGEWLQLNGNSVKESRLKRVELSGVDTGSEGEVIVSGEVLGSLTSEYPGSEVFKREGLTMRLLGESRSSIGDPKRIVSKGVSELTDSELVVIAGLYKWWLAGGLALNRESYGLDFEGASVKEIGLYFYDGSEELLAGVPYETRDDGIVTALKLKVNMRYYQEIDKADKDGDSSEGSYLDRTMAHELTHGLMMGKINYFEVLPQYVAEGLAELVHGIDDERGQRIFELAVDSSRLDSALDMGDTGTGSPDCYAGGYMFYRYYSKQAALEDLPAFGEITAIVDLVAEGEYRISGESFVEIAGGWVSGLKLGSLSLGEYKVMDTGVHQVISADGIRVVGLTRNDTLIGGDSGNTVATSAGSYVSLGVGADSVEINGQYSTVKAGGGADTVVITDGGHHWLDMGSGRDYVEIRQGYSYENTVIAGAGDDEVVMRGSELGVIDLGMGSDLVKMQGRDNSVVAGSGNDTVMFELNGGGGNYIELGAGDDCATITGGGNTIVFGGGSDSIYAHNTTGNYYIFGGGAARINGYRSSDTLLISEGSEYERRSGVLTIREGGEVKGELDLVGYSGGLKVIYGKVPTLLVNEIENEEDGRRIVGTGSADSIRNGGSNVTIVTGAGDDTIYNNGMSLVVDYIGGSDVYFGLDATSSLLIGGGVGSYSVKELGAARIVVVGEDTIKLIDSGDLGINIIGEEVKEWFIELTSESNEVEIHGEGYSIKCGGGSDRIVIGEDAGGVYIEDFGVGDEIVLPIGWAIDRIGGLSLSTESWSLSCGLATYVRSEGASLTGNKIVYNVGDGFSVSGVKSLAGLSLSGDVVTVGLMSLGLSSVTISEGYSLVLAEEVEPTVESSSVWSYSAGIAENVSTVITSLYEVVENEIIYTQSEVVSSVLVNGVISASGLSLSGNIVTVGLSSLSESAVTISDGYRLALGLDVPLPIAREDSGWAFTGGSAIYKSTTATSGYKLWGGRIVYIPENVDEFLTVSGVTSAVGLSLNGEVVTVGLSSLGLSSVTISDGYRLELGADVIRSERPLEPVWRLSGTIASYVELLTTAGYELEDNRIRYTDEVIGKTLLALSGIATAPTVEGGTVKISRENIAGLGESESESKYKVRALASYSTNNDSEATLIIGNNKKNILTAGTNGSTLNGGKGNDTLVGGDGADIFVYEQNSGKDVVENYGVGDKISLGAGAVIKDASVSSGDSIIKIGTGSLTVKETTALTLTSELGNDTILSNGIFVEQRSSIAKVFSSFKGTVELGLGVTTADALLAKKKITIVGSAASDSIIGGNGKDALRGELGDDYISGGRGADTLWGGSGNDTLEGGKGNDELYGGDGNDVFIFHSGDGNDVIKDYDGSLDVLWLFDKQNNPTTFNKAVFNGKALSLSIRGGGKIIFENVTAESAFQINDVDYRINGKRLARL